MSRPATFAPSPSAADEPPWRGHVVEQNVGDILVGRFSVAFEQMLAQLHLGVPIGHPGEPGGFEAENFTLELKEDDKVGYAVGG